MLQALSPVMSKVEARFSGQSFIMLVNRHIGTKVGYSRLCNNFQRVENMCFLKQIQSEVEVKICV